jgi:hypothetical protein
MMTYQNVFWGKKGKEKGKNFFFPSTDSSSLLLTALFGAACRLFCRLRRGGSSFRLAFGFLLHFDLPLGKAEHVSADCNLVRAMPLGK